MRCNFQKLIMCCSCYCLACCLLKLGNQPLADQVLVLLRMRNMLATRGSIGIWSSSQRGRWTPEVFYACCHCMVDGFNAVDALVDLMYYAHLGRWVLGKTTSWHVRAASWPLAFYCGFLPALIIITCKRKVVLFLYCRRKRLRVPVINSSPTKLQKIASGDRKRTGVCGCSSHI